MVKRTQTVGRKNLGDILIEMGVIDQKTLNEALSIQNRRLGEVLVENKLADPVRVAEALKFQAKTSGFSSGSQVHLTNDEVERFLDLLDDLKTTKLSEVRKRFESLLLIESSALIGEIKSIVTSVEGLAGKKVHLEVQVDPFSFERTLTAELFEAILHLVRNAMDHGVETDIERAAVGKPLPANITVSLRIRDAHLHAVVRDDGRGINSDSILKKARQMKIVDESATGLTSEQLTRILFTPGFTTKERPSALSGRGVGLDAVEAVVTRNGGTLSVHSKEGNFTEFGLQIPLRMYSEKLIICKAGDRLFALPQRDVLVILQASDATIAGERVIVAAEGDGISPKLALRTKLGFLVAVEEVIETDDFVIRSIHSKHVDDRGVIGVARLESGDPVLLLSAESFNGK